MDRLPLEHVWSDARVRRRSEQEVKGAISDVEGFPLKVIGLDFGRPDHGDRRTIAALTRGVYSTFKTTEDASLLILSLGAIAV
jgi:hypothetical protein